MVDYVKSWQEYRRRRNLFLFFLIGYLPVFGIVSVVTEKVYDCSTPGFVTALIWLVFIAVSGVRVEIFRCPECGKCFFAKWWYHNILARRCVHCGLPKYAISDAEQD
jgi:hypothetical protein